MLTLFKPWRSPKSLRTQSKSWDTVFSEYSFSPEQEQLMANFNILYECKDARDDYSSKLKKQEISDPKAPFYLSHELMQEMDTQQFQHDGENFLDEEAEAEYLECSERAQRAEENKALVENAVVSGGWLNPLDQTAEIFIPECDVEQQTSASWKALVAAEKDKVILLDILISAFLT